MEASTIMTRFLQSWLISVETVYMYVREGAMGVHVV